MTTPTKELTEMFDGILEFQGTGLLKQELEDAAERYGMTFKDGNTLVAKFEDGVLEVYGEEDDDTNSPSSGCLFRAYLITYGPRLETGSPAYFPTVGEALESLKQILTGGRKP